jgi:hypothetical protein
MTRMISQCSKFTANSLLGSELKVGWEVILGEVSTRLRPQNFQCRVPKSFRILVITKFFVSSYNLDQTYSKSGTTTQ